jgi:hypothetical protein
MNNQNNKEKIYISAISGSIAGIAQLTTLYWLRTMIKYQYVYNQDLTSSWKKLRASPDPFRLFRGIMPNSLKVGFGKIGEAGIITYFKPKKEESNIFYNSIFSSVLITGWKLGMMPLDTLGNSYQVSGFGAKQIVNNKIDRYGYKILWTGTYAYTGISFINYSIWVTMYNYLNFYLPTNINMDLRNGIIGFSSTVCSDLVVNPLRVIKTYKQSYKDDIDYSTIIKEKIIKEKRYFRGIQGKMIFNCFNSSLYVILWKRLDKIISG